MLAGAVGLAAPPPARAADSAPAGCTAGPDACFVLTSLTIDGVTAYPLKALAPLYADHLAREVSVEDLVRIAQAITDKYRSDGYFLSRAVVPPQTDPRGHARLVVLEGYVGEVEVTGDAAPALEGLLAGLTERRPLRLADLEKRLTLATDLPGVRARTIIEPILDDPARHRLVVRSGLQRWTASLYVDNRGTRAVGPEQAYARVGLNSLARAGDQLALSVLTVPDDPDEFAQGELSYGASLADGSRLRAAVSASRSREGTSPLNNTVGNESRALNLRLARPVVRERKRALWAAVAFDARHVEQTFFNGARYEDELRVLRGSLQADRWRASGSTSLFLQVSRGLDGLGASDDVSTAHSRFDADGQFWKVNVAGSHYTDVGSRAGLYVAADAQWAPHPLLLSEEFAPGGLPYGRGYNYAEISGDSGLAGLVEVRVGWDPGLRPLTFFQSYAFVDAAKVWNRGPVAGARSAAFSSAGAGVRLTFRDKVTLRVEAARPLTRTPWVAGDKDWRLFASLWAGF